MSINLLLELRIGDFWADFCYYSYKNICSLAVNEIRKVIEISIKFDVFCVIAIVTVIIIEGDL